MSRMDMISRIHATCIEIGEEKGIEEGEKRGIALGEKRKALATARKMIDKNFPIELISEITGLSGEEIEDLN